MTTDARVDVRVDRPPNPDGDHVLYWMVAARRARSSPALERALHHARTLKRPLLVLEALRLGYRWASVRLHQFVVQGMADNARAFADAGVRYHAYVEPEAGHGKGLLAALAQRAAVVVTDDFPCFFLPRMLDAATAQLSVRLEAVDGNGVLPLSAAPRAFTTAASFRRHLHKTLRPWLRQLPDPEPLRGYDLGWAEVPAEVASRWPHAGAWLSDPASVRSLPLDGLGAGPLVGGAVAGERAMEAFLEERLQRYPQRNHPDEDVASGLSPWLHFGHVSAAELVRRVLVREEWTEERLGPVTGSRAGWWGCSEAAESFLDEAITWRELGYVFCRHVPTYARFASLPEWARTTLAHHASDPRPEIYDLEELAAAGTDDPIWNAAQRQLLAEGRIHNYLRMLWGKGVLRWSASPEAAWERLIELNNRYALDGRNPNSYSGIGWVFGRFDRAWGPERPIFGKVRYMTSDSTRRKLRLKSYLERWRRR
ncbi:MAG: deoxyribodipyrimidine photolyase [Myxococcales bacterium]|nr:deoxyribodipyrimidine photolyase [Myxococcales bacterium]